jgi:hypothetical protein
MNRMTQAIKKGWDALAETHYKNYHIDRLIAGTPLLNELIRKEIGDVKDKSLYCMTTVSFIFLTVIRFGVS